MIKFIIMVIAMAHVGRKFRLETARVSLSSSGLNDVYEPSRMDFAFRSIAAICVCVQANGKRRGSFKSARARALLLIIGKSL